MIYVGGWNPENCPIIPFFLILCDDFMAIFAKLYFSFSGKMKCGAKCHKVNVLIFYFYFFNHPDDYSFSGGKKKTDEYLFKLTLFSVPSLPTALVSEFPEVFLIRLFLLLEITLKAFLLVSYCFGC